MCVSFNEIKTVPYNNKKQGLTPAKIKMTPRTRFFSSNTHIFNAGSQQNIPKACKIAPNNWSKS